MTKFKYIKDRLSFIQRYQYRWVIKIAIIWTTIDFVYWISYVHSHTTLKSDAIFEYISPEVITLRCSIVFFMSCLMGYILFFKLRQLFRNFPLFVNLLVKTVILSCASLFMNFLLHFTYSVFILHFTFYHGLQRFFGDATSLLWLLQHSVGWIILFLVTQITIEINEKYSPGIFWDILIGKYIEPKVQKRIVMFMDLHDSTPIAEQLGSKNNFRFIRDFIYFVSIALLEYNGRIYQYVGDEIVVSWMYTPQNVYKCLSALVLSTRILKRNSSYFKQHYGVIPEFKAGIHMGEVTVGEIGIIKKDIAMSGDTMNTAARIRSSCIELNHKYIASKDFLDSHDIIWETESLGLVDLKGKSESMELFALKI